MMYLVADHAEVNAAGFANPEHERYESLPISKQETGLFQVAAEFRAPVLTSEDFILLNETPPGPGFAVVLRMSDLPYEAVAFVWRETDNRWAITSMFAAVG